LGEDRFVTKYSELLQDYYNGLKDSEDDDVEMRGNLGTWLICDWKPVASKIVKLLGVADADYSIQARKTKPQMRKRI
jgi:hypothetical protein